MKDDSQCVVVNMVVRYGDGMSEEHGPSHEEAAQSLRRVFASVVGDGALTEFSGHEVEVDEYGLEVSAVETSFSQVWSIGNENDLVSKVGIDLSDRQQINQRLAALGLTPVTDFLEMLSFPGPVSITDHRSERLTQT